MKLIPTLRQLQYLVAVADHRHFGRAADSCFVTQSTLSSGIQDLESILDCRLIERGTRRQVMLTPLGEDIVERARALLRDAEALAEVAETGRRPLAGRLRLGVIPTIGPYFLPRALPAVRSAYPDLKLYLREDQTARLVDGLHAGRLDCAVLATPYDLGDLASLPLGADHLLVAVPAQHPYAGKGAIAPADLETEDMLMLEDGHCLREHSLDACAGHVLKANEAVQATSLGTLVQMVANGLGITLIPEMAVPTEAYAGSGVVARRFVAPEPSRGIALVWRASSPRKKEFELLAEVLRTHLEAANV
ncbi:Hydrogen peroxide-inducible genes activator [uncultured Alphaproteobacteria bacterium]|uniref:Hydrogen peroxide-inducible genes activator n=1 Tax=uncultured Alphaproteobacteria bacterium TaxID=91750 RepID=A0A212JIH1_9PROT|nr:Hydrogen peroxide-inducible genes activator [uncultured Alphaproteobacteria bacterium]